MRGRPTCCGCTVKKAAALTLLFDVLKGVVAVLIAMLVDWCALRFVDGSSLTYFENAYLLGNLKYIAGFFAVLGHDFPIFSVPRRQGDCHQPGRDADV